ncbi:hypothetical protein CEXT_703331 [Caerostris extrusa]|uniref:Uncharacterized protein n=1 Tax=Caerostris extrusa TaxID=172846 RepID=A0AAV4SCK6_CAEEX|nr:hypothetical protein CEXT_703331 [Caerostris extrusa]
MAGMIGRRLSARYFRYLTLVKRSHKHLMQHVSSSALHQPTILPISPRAPSRRGRHRLSSRISNLPCTKECFKLTVLEEMLLHSVVHGGSIVVISS